MIKLVIVLGIVIVLQVINLMISLITWAQGK